MDEKKKYTVSIDYTFRGFVSFEVEAEDKDCAEKKLYSRLKNVQKVIYHVAMARLIVTARNCMNPSRTPHEKTNH